MKDAIVFFLLATLLGCANTGEVEKEPIKEPVVYSYKEISEKVSEHGREAVEVYESIIDAHLFLKGMALVERLKEICGEEGCMGDGQLGEYPYPEEKIPKLIGNYETIRQYIDSMEGSEDFFVIVKVARLIQGLTYSQLPRGFSKKSSKVTGLLWRKCQNETKPSIVDYCEHNGWR